MEFDADSPGATEDADGETEPSVRETSRSESGSKSKFGLTTPNQMRLLNRGIKVAFAIALTALFVYWGLAYQYEVVWFEF